MTQNPGCLRGLVMACVLVAASDVPGLAETVEIHPRHNEITWEDPYGQGTYDIEWAAHPNGPWYSSWDNMVGLPATGGTMTMPWPRFFRLQYRFLPDDGVLTYGNLRWDPYRIQWAIQDGWMQSLPLVREGFNYGHSGSGRGAMIYTHLGDPTWRDYSVEFDVELLGIHPTFNPYGLPACFRRAELVFRATAFSENWNRPVITKYGFTFEPTTCGTGDTIQGRWWLGRQQDYYYYPGTGWKPTYAGCSTQLASGSSDAILDGVNHVRIDCIGNRFQIWFNGESVVDFTDDVVACSPQNYGAIQYGGFGMWTHFEDMIRFRNVTVTHLDD